MPDQPNRSGNDQSALLDMTKSASQWYSQMSMANVIVPKFSSTKDVYDFVTEYEDATSALAEEYRSKLLYKAFPPGDHRSWFEIELKPIIESGSEWSRIRSAIIDRFSIQGDRARHFTRLRDLKYNPDSSRMLLDFVDDMLYSYRRAYKNDQDDESCIAFIKSSLPQTVQGILSANPDYRDAKDIATLKQAAKQYDISKRTNEGLSTSRQVTNELTSMVKELVTSLRKELEQNQRDTKKELESTKSAIMAVMRSNQQERDQPNRERQVQRSTYESRRSPSPSFSRRSPSPGAYERRYPPAIKFAPKNEPQGRSERPKVNEDPKDATRQAFNSKSYFELFGMPPSPCSLCNEGSWHWSKHCFNQGN